MKKYIVLAFLPIFFQSNLYCQDINEVIKPQLQMARMLMNNNTPLEFQAILDALVFFGKKGQNQANVAVIQLKSIKAALEKYRAEEYKTTWDNICWFFGFNPKKVVFQIDPALDGVNRALKILHENSRSLGYTIAVSVLGVSAITLATLWFILNGNNTFSNQEMIPVSSGKQAPTLDDVVVLYPFPNADDRESYINMDRLVHELIEREREQKQILFKNCQPGDQQAQAVLERFGKLIELHEKALSEARKERGNKQLKILCDVFDQLNQKLLDVENGEVEKPLMLEEVAPLPFSQEEKDFQAKREDIIQNYERQAAAARIKNDAEAAAMSAQFESKNAFAAAQEALDAAVQCSQKDVVQKARNAAQAAKDAAQEALNAAGNARAHPNANNIKVALDAGAQARVASRNANFAAGEAWSVR